jgi:hypothetical protein
LGIRIVILDEPPLIQAQPIPDECELLAQFTQQETLLALVLWRMYDETLMTTHTKGVLFTLNELWLRWQIIFPKIEAPTLSALKESLARLKRKRLIRFSDSEDPTRPGDALVEVLPTLHRVIDFNGLEEWQARVSAFQSDAEPSEESPANPPVPVS